MNFQLPNAFRFLLDDRLVNVLFAHQRVQFAFQRSENSTRRNRVERIATIT